MDLELGHGFIPRIGEENYKAVDRCVGPADLFNPDPLDLPWAIIDGAWAEGRPELLNTLRNHGTKLLVDTHGWRYRYGTRPWSSVCWRFRGLLRNLADVGCRATVPRRPRARTRSGTLAVLSRAGGATRQLSPSQHEDDAGLRAVAQPALRSCDDQRRARGCEPGHPRPEAPGEPTHVGIAHDCDGFGCLNTAFPSARSSQASGPRIEARRPSRARTDRSCSVVERGSVGRMRPSVSQIRVGAATGRQARL